MPVALTFINVKEKNMNSYHYIVNVEAAIYYQDKWLIATRSTKEKHAGGTLALIGGKVETKQIQDNILESTVRREIMEEVGIEVADAMHYIKSSFFITQDGKPVINIIFLCKYKQGEAKVIDPNELSAIQWMSYEEIINNPLTPPWTKASLKEANKLKG